jgi:hypothetical protein
MTNLIDRFIGIWVDGDIHEYCTLYGLAEGDSKSKLVRSLIVYWKWKKEKEYPVSKLQDQISRKVETEWRVEKPEIINSLKGDESKIEVAIELIKTRMKSKLEQKGLSDKQILIILNKISP